MEPGAVWEDFRVWVEYWTRWERVAVVTDVTWIANVVNALRFLLPGQIVYFRLTRRKRRTIGLASQKRPPEGLFLPLGRAQRGSPSAGPHSRRVGCLGFRYIPSLSSAARSAGTVRAN